MAIAVIGGLTTSTLLTLVVIPVIFTYMDGFQTRIFRLVRGGGKKHRKTVVENGKGRQHTATTKKRNVDILPR